MNDLIEELQEQSLGCCPNGVYVCCMLIISCYWSVGIHFRYVLAISLVGMRRNNVSCASGLKITITYKGDKILAIFLLDKLTKKIFYCVCAEMAI